MTHQLVPLVLKPPGLHTSAVPAPKVCWCVAVAPLIQVGPGALLIQVLQICQDPVLAILIIIFGAPGTFHGPAGLIVCDRDFDHLLDRRGHGFDFASWNCKI